jgi:hypothetical protein
VPTISIIYLSTEVFKCRFRIIVISIHNAYFYVYDLLSENVITRLKFILIMMATSLYILH